MQSLQVMMQCYGKAFYTPLNGIFALLHINRYLCTFQQYTPTKAKSHTASLLFLFVRVFNVFVAVINRQ